jgi:hypothetical protein
MSSRKCKNIVGAFAKLASGPFLVDLAATRTNGAWAIEKILLLMTTTDDG